MEKRTREKVNNYVKTWEDRCYTQGIPDTVPIDVFDKVPSYHRIALCILKNDLHLEGLGYQGFRSVFYDELKRIELKDRDKQLRIF